MPENFQLSSFMPYRLTVLAERISRRLAVEYGRTHGLNLAEWRVLAHLKNCGQVSIRDIHERVDLEKPRVSRAVTRLEAFGLVAKTSGQQDGRLVAITLTEQGLAALDEITPEVADVEAGLLSSLTKQEAQNLSAILEKLHKALDADPLAKPRVRIEVDKIAK